MIRSPHSLLLQLTRKYDDEIHFPSGVKLFIDPSFNPNWNVSCTGIAASEGWGVKTGDEVLFSYKVVGDVTHESDPASFYRVTKQEGFYMEWANQNKEKLMLQAGIKKGQWSAVHTDKKGDLLNGFRGTQGQVENWATSNFKFTAAEGFTFDNVLEIDGQEFWRVDPDQVFAVKGKEGWRMLNDHVLIEPIVEKVPDLIGSILHNADGGQFRLREDKGWVRGIKGVPGVSNGDVVYFDPTFKEKYQIEGKPMYILKNRYLLAKEVSSLIAL